MYPLGSQAPHFRLYDTVSGQFVSLNEIKSDIATVIMFISNHCPFVKHVNQQLVDLASEYLKKGVSFIAICSNDVNDSPDDSPEKMKETALNLKYPFPYLYDETQETAKAYDAACTPDLYVFDKELRLVYRGQLDDSRPSNNIPVTGRDIRNALDNIILRKPVSLDQKPSIGCNIKWNVKSAKV